MIGAIISIIGALLALIIPGFLLSHILIGKLDLETRLAVAVGLNITLIALLLFSLTFISRLIDVKTFTPEIIYISLAAMSAVFFLALMSKDGKMNRRRLISKNKH